MLHLDLVGLFGYGGFVLLWCCCVRWLCLLITFVGLFVYCDLRCVGYGCVFGYCGLIVLIWYYIGTGGFEFVSYVIYALLVVACCWFGCWLNGVVNALFALVFWLCCLFVSGVAVVLLVALGLDSGYRAWACYDALVCCLCYRITVVVWCWYCCYCLLDLLGFDCCGCSV